MEFFEKIWNYNIIIFFISRVRDNLKVSAFFFIDIFQEWCYNHYIHHHFYVIDRGWVAAGDLVEGDEIYLLDGATAVITGSELEQLSETIKVYNFEVEDFHTYFVGENGIFVHNGCGDDLAKPGEDLYVGTYSKSKYANKKSGLNSTHTPHHVVQDAISPTSHGKGITINLRKDLHELTGTYKRKGILIRMI